MSHLGEPSAWAEVQVAAVRDDPSARRALHDRTSRGPTGRAPRRLRFRLTAPAFDRELSVTADVVLSDGFPAPDRLHR